MIPKKIHYCWFGNAPKDKKTLEYIQGWKDLLPDYEIHEWNDSDLKKIKNQYALEAFKNKKWAFVSDYFRLYALYCEGGIYLDTDIEIKKSLDPFLNLDFFIGSELYKQNKQIGTAVIGAKRKSPIIKKFLNTYKKIHFKQKNGKLDFTPNTQRLIPLLMEIGFKEFYSEKKAIYLDKKNIIYPIQYFSKPSHKSFAVHHFFGSWLTTYTITDKFTLPFFNSSKLILRRYKNISFRLEENEKKFFQWKKRNHKTYYVLLLKK